MADSSEVSVVRCAAVRYGDNQVEVVSVAKVKRLGEPKHFYDFKAGKIYKVKTSKWNVEGREETFEAIVEGLGGVYFLFFSFTFIC